MRDHPSELERNSPERWRGWLGVVVMIGSILACGGVGEAIGEQDVQLENVSISGLPQFVAPSSTPIPTDTQMPTAIQPTIHMPASSYVTHTPAPGLVYVCNGAVCGYATLTPNGGHYTNPAYNLPGATSTPRPTYTPYPSPTPCLSSFTYYYGEEVFTDPAPNNLTLGLALGNLRVFPSVRPDQQIVGWTVEVRNLGQIEYVLLAPFQIYIARLDDARVRYYVNQEAANELGVTLDEAAVDGVTIGPAQSRRFDLYAYTAVGEVTSLSYILDPYGSGFDGAIAGGNVAYWQSGERDGCGGRIGEAFTPPPNLTPQPTATLTPTPDYGCYENPDRCVAIIGGN